MKLLIASISLAFAVLKGVGSILPGDVGYLTIFSSHKPAQVQQTTTTAIPQFARQPHEIQTSVCKNAHTNEHYKGELVGREEVYYWAAKYWSGQDLEIAVALTVPEGQRDLFCISDETAPYYGQPTGDGRHYGYSVGLYQWRTVIEQTGKGGCEDANWQLGNIERQTQCAKAKYDSKFPNGTPRHWTPWTAYTKNRYQKWLGK